MSTDLVAVDLTQLPSTQLGGATDLDALMRGGSFLSRLQLYSKGKPVDKKLIVGGHYGIPEGGDEITDLGEQIDVVAFAIRTKALDLTDRDAPISVYDRASEEFQRIEAESEVKDSSCMVGPSFLLYERTTGRPLEFFCSNASARSEAKKIKAYLPLSQADIDNLAAHKQDVSNLVAHGPIPFTLKSRFVEKGAWSWFAPVVVRSSVPFTNLPPIEIIVKEINAFVSPKREGPEVVTKPQGKKRSR